MHPPSLSGISHGYPDVGIVPVAKTGPISASAVMHPAVPMGPRNHHNRVVCAIHTSHTLTETGTQTGCRRPSVSYTSFVGPAWSGRLSRYAQAKHPQGRPSTPLKLFTCETACFFFILIIAVTHSRGYLLPNCPVDCFRLSQGWNADLAPVSLPTRSAVCSLRISYPCEVRCNTWHDESFVKRASSCWIPTPVSRLAGLARIDCHPSFLRPEVLPCHSTYA